MAVSLSKIVNGPPAVADNLANAHIVACPKCDDKYRLGYSDGD